MQKHVFIIILLGVLLAIKGSCSDAYENKNQSVSLKPLEWWQRDVFYHVLVRSLKDTNGDGIGDLKGVTASIPHFLEAGIGVISLSPFNPSPLVDLGYDISDHYGVHEDYGTMEDFDDLVLKAHESDLKIIVNFVPNHASTDSKLFKLSETRQPGYENFFVWADPLYYSSERTPPSNWMSLFGGSMWQWSETRQQYYLHQFTETQADFNFRDPAVRKEMLNIIKFWLKKGADGIRVDTVAYLFEAEPDDNGKYPDEPPSTDRYMEPDNPDQNSRIYTKHRPEVYDVVNEWRAFIDEWQANNKTETKVLLIEAFTNTSMTMKNYGKNDESLQYPFTIEFLLNFPDQPTARDFASTIRHWITYMSAERVPVWVMGTDDQKRIATRFGHNKVDGMNALIMMLPGVCLTYQGEEIGMKDVELSWSDTHDTKAFIMGSLDYSRDPNRTPFQWDNSTSAGFSTSDQPWLPVDPDYMTLNLEAQKEASQSNFKVYQALIKLREEPALSHGDIRVIHLSDNTLLVLRYLQTFDSYALVFNVGNKTDVVCLRNGNLLREPLTVCTSSVHSSRVPGDRIHLGKLILLPGEAILLRFPGMVSN